MNQTGGRGASRWYLVSAIAACALTVVACAGETTPGKARTAGDIAGLPVTHFESGLKPGAPSPDLTVDNVSDSEEDQLAVAAIADVSDYWSEQFATHFEEKFEPVERLLSYDPEGEPIEVCGADTSDAAFNAFYCPSEDVVAWDRGILLPLLHEKFGPMAIGSVLGHEFGHAVQYRLGDKAGVDDSTSTIVKEQQADCFTGAYFRWIAEGKSKYFRVSTSEGLNQVLAALYFIRDEAGQSADAESAHGTAFDRTYAFQLGFEEGSPRCAEIDQDEIDERITEQPFDPADRYGGDIPINAKYVEDLQDSLDQAFSAVGAELPEITDGDGSCPGGGGTPPASYCPGDNTVAIDMDALAEIGEPVDREAEIKGGESDGGLGDFAAFAEIASRYVQGVQKGVGAPLDDPNAGLRTACLVGAWAKAIVDPPKGLQLSSGDLDEAIAELMQPRSLIAADVNGHRVANGFARVEALRVGYVQGSPACTKEYA